jgi:hypothetical protein
MTKTRVRRETPEKNRKAVFFPLATHKKPWYTFPVRPADKTGRRNGGACALR